MSSSRALAAGRARVARAVQHGDRSEELAARRDYAAAKIEEHVRGVVDQAPPLTDEQRARIAALLAGGGS